MRLIDADALMERIASINNPDMLTIGKVVGMIDTQPTAYDIDKVVEELEEMKIIDGSMKTKLCIKFDEMTVNRAIVIVMRGGKNDD